MSESVFSILELARESLPSSLFDEEGYAHLATIAQMFPEELTTFWGFECRLGEPEAKADILFETKKQSRGLSLLAGHTPSSLDTFCEQWPTWQSLRTFAKHWADPDHLFYNSIRNIWLEFDAAAVASSTQVAEVIRQPCIFFGPEAKAHEKDQLLSVVLDALAALGETNLGRSSLQPFIAALPDGAQLFQVGLMLARVNPGMRVCVNKLIPEEIPEWLSKLNWSGDTQTLERLLQKITPLLNTMAVDLNLLKDRPAEKIGLECYMDWLVDDSKQWIPLLDFIEELNLCLPQKRQGFLNFPGITQNPPHKRLSDGGVLYLNLFRKIHHIKLSLAEGQVVEAKAYLALSRPGIYFGNSLNGDLRDAWIGE